MLTNLGPDAKIVQNKAGGKQSKVDFAFHLLDAPALMSLAAVTQYGSERYARDNWRLIDEEEHINHALIHLYAYMAGDTQDQHLDHAFCRIMFALAKKLRPDYY